MGAADASFRLLLDAVSSLETFVTVFIYVLSSWVRLPYSPWLRRIQDFLRDVCEPYLRLFRRVLPPLGPLDVSPIVAIFALYLVRYIVNGVVLSRLH